jgi:gluconolactonase
MRSVVRLLAVALVISCSSSGSDAPTGGAGGSGGGTGGSAGSGGRAPGGNGGSAGGGGSGGSITAGAGGSGGSAVDSGGVPEASGGAGGSSGSGGQDADVPDSAPADTTSTPTPRNRCPAGPFETPKAGASKGICGNLLKYNWSEGPTWVASQNAFFFSNFQVGQAGPGDILKYTPSTGMCETFLTNVGCNGLGVSNDGQILAPCHTPRALMKYDPVTKQGTVLLKMVDGKMLDSPNDVIQHSNGMIYFTNPTFELAGRGQGLGPAAVRLDPAGNATVIARGGVNGIGLSPDEKKLYIGMQGVWDLDDQGIPVRKAGNAPLGGDGFAIDCAGNIYNQAGAISSPSGQRIGSFPGGTNQAFGGPDGKLLLVASRRMAQIVEMNVPGLP